MHNFCLYFLYITWTYSTCYRVKLFHKDCNQKSWVHYELFDPFPILGSLQQLILINLFQALCVLHYILSRVLTCAGRKSHSQAASCSVFMTAYVTLFSWSLMLSRKWARDRWHWNKAIRWGCISDNPLWYNLVRGWCAMINSILLPQAKVALQYNSVHNM